MFNFDNLRGKLITFEGIDGSGKSTQINKLYEWVEQHWSPYPKVILTAEPSCFDTSLGHYLKNLLLSSDDGLYVYPDTELLLYLADRAQHVEEYIQPYLDDGYLVLCDRYIDSTFAYQVIGKGASGRVFDSVSDTLNFPEPDLTFYLDLPLNVAQARAVARGKLDRVESLGSAYFKRVLAGYQGRALTETHRIKTIPADAYDPKGISFVVQNYIKDIFNL